MRITRIQIKNFMGLQQLDVAIPPAGALIKGDNAVGKTTVLRAIKTCLAAQGVGPECIRQGADKAEILIDLDAAIKARRAITPQGSTFTVTNSEGDKWSKPQSRLTDLIGANLDPLAFYLAKPAERRALLLSAMPVQVTAEDLLRWTGDKWSVEAGKHGLEVVADVRKHYYDQRRDANRAATEAQSRYTDAMAEADGLASDTHKGVVIPVRNGEEDEPVRAAEKAREALDHRRQQAEAMAKRTEGTRARVAELRSKAQKVEQDARPPVPADVAEKVEADWRAAGAEVTRLQDLLADATQRHRNLAEKMNELAAQRESNARSMGESTRLRQQAADLEATLAETAIEPPTADELAKADAAVVQAKAHADLVRSARAAHDAMADAAALGDEAKEAKDKADRLDAIVERLTKEAPGELAARSQMIPGVAIEGDAITVDGKPIDNLSGAEQMQFAVEVVRRANAKGKLLVVDELEKLSAKRLPEFVRLCTAGGYQLLGTRVTEGELVIEAIEPEAETKAA